MKSKTRLWRGLSAVMAFLLVISVFTAQVANNNAGGINNFLGLSAPTAAPPTDADPIFVSDYGELSDEALSKLIADEMAFCIEQMEEGAVLLHNNGALPLAETERSVTLFGRASADLRYRNTNGGGSPDPNREINMKKAFNDAGFTINDTLFDAYASSSTQRVKSGDETEDVGEESISFYTDSLRATFADYSDVAIVVLSRYGGESTDISRKNVDGVPTLSLQPDEADLLTMINESGVYDKIVVLLNSVYPLELGWLEEYNVDACLWMGNPGYYGLPGVVNILTGEANPSGHLVDTYATNSLSSAAMQNFGEFRFANGDALPSYSNRYVVYQEGIYVGYKYYETRYEDAVLGQGNANGTAGMFASQGEGWNYADEMCYPFGYGLSYTTFEQTLDSVEYDAASDTFTATVTVTNTGDMAGKSVVQVYVQTPYTDYDREHGVEKASIQLAGFGKTQELEPQASETVEVTFSRYLFASYDITAHEGEGGYILDAGNYYFAIGENSHDALNNILAAKGATGMYDQDGNPVEGNAEKTFLHSLDAFDDQSYLVSVHTDVEVHNLFGYADANAYYDNNPVTYLSRNDWQGTWSDGVALSNNAAMEDALITAKYDPTSSSVSTEDVPYGVDAGIKLYDMIGVPFEDPKWTTFVQQLSMDDLGVITNENYGQGAIESISKPANTCSEGSEGCSLNYNYGDKGISTGYASNNVTSATWNTEIQWKYGNFVGEDALFCGATRICGPGGDTHRTPYCGRFAEYFSEDSVISYNVGMTINNAMIGKGLLNSYKHFFLNEQEYDRQGIATFANEQSMREIYLRAYEGGVTCEGGMGMMTSYNRIGPVYMAADPVVQYDLLEDEWGYKGYKLTDYLAEGDYSVTADMMINGTNTFGGNDRSTSLKQLILRNKNGDLLLAAQESAHRVLWAYVNSSLANSLSPSAVYADFVAWWQYALMGIQGGLGVITLAMVVLYIRSAYFRKKQ